MEGRSCSIFGMATRLDSSGYSFRRRQFLVVQGALQTVIERRGASLNDYDNVNRLTSAMYSASVGYNRTFGNDAAINLTGAYDGGQAAFRRPSHSQQPDQWCELRCGGQSTGGKRRHAQLRCGEPASTATDRIPAGTAAADTLEPAAYSGVADTVLRPPLRYLCG